MKACTFFGHRECPDKITDILEPVLIDLIENKNINIFYVGNQGHFDSVVRKALRKLKDIYPQISYSVILAYMPEGNVFDSDHNYETMLPDGIEGVPKRFAISWRNKWMLAHSDYVVAYINHGWGGAAQFASLASKQHKTVFNLGSLPDNELSDILR